MRPSHFLAAAIVGLGCAALAVSACASEDVNVRPRLDGGTPEGGTSLGCGVAIPTAYESPAFAANASADLALTKSLLDLDAKMASTEGGSTTTVTFAELDALYTGGNPSLRSVSTATSFTLVDAYLKDFASAQGKTWDPADVKDGGAPNGGKFKGLFHESPIGIDLRAATTKAILGGALYNQALSIIAQGVTQTSVDRLLALFGASTALANTTGVEAGDQLDRLVAELASKRDDDTAPTGIYRRMRTALLTMKATAGNDACKADLDAAVAAYLLGWEQATYASAIFALNAASGTALNPDNAALTLHSYGEALGLIQSFKGIPAERRKINDSQIDLVLGNIHADAPSGLVTDPGGRINELTSAINNIAAFEGFDPAAVESFKKSF